MEKKVHNGTNSTIMYVNFSPYENAGSILDYLMDNYSVVIVFSLKFHELQKGDRSSYSIYQLGKLKSRQEFYHVPTPKSLVFLLLPLRSLIMFFQLLYFAYKLKKKYQVINTYFTVNAFTAWTGNILRSFGLVQKTVFWVWDYYPPVHKSIIIMIMRNIYWYFDRVAANQADRTVFLNLRLEKLRKEIGVLSDSKTYPIIEIGTNPIPKLITKSTHPLSLVFLGVLKKSQGLQLIFDVSENIASIYPNAILHIIGSGPDEQYFRRLAKQSQLRTIFHGFIQNDLEVNKIISTCTIGIATYIPEKSNVSYYSDPSKIKRYLSLGLPVVTTNVFSFSRTIVKSRSGIVVDYNKSDQILSAINTIVAQYASYRKNAWNLAKKYSYKTLYKKIFL